MRVLVLWMALASATLAAAADWPRFRGPNGSGVADDAAFPATWTDDDYRWQVKLPGSGHSSPIVWGDHLYVTAADVDSGQRWLLCYHVLDGRQLWSRVFAFQSYKKHLRNSYATGTPCADELGVYLAWHTREGSQLVALDHQGRDRWTYDLPPFGGGHGGGASPIVVGQLVVVNNDQEGDSFLLAVDRHSGQPRWQVPREQVAATYATPCLFTADGTPQIIFTNWHHGFTSIDPESGRTRWELDVFDRSDPKRSIGSPVVYRDLVIGTSGFAGGQKYLVAVRPRGNSAEEVYRMGRAVAHMPTVLVYRDRLYVWDDKGIVTCADAATGKEIWQQRVGGNFSGSPVAASGRIYCLSDSGEAIVLAASDEFEELGRVALGEGTSSTPAIAANTLFLRTDTHLFALPAE